MKSKSIISKVENGKYLPLNILLLVCFQFALYISNGQQLIIFEENNVIQRDYHYEEMQSPESTTNFLIRKMARITAPTQQIFFGFTLYENRQIIKLPNHQYAIRFTIDSIKFYNHLNFINYKLDSIVFPNLLSIKYIIYNQNQDLKQNLTHQQNFDVQLKVLLDTIVVDKTQQAFYKIEAVDYQFGYTEDVKTLLDSTLNSILKLESFRPDLYSIRQRLTNLQSVKTGVVRIYNIDLKKIEAELSKINPREGVKNTDVLNFENEGLIALYDSLTAATKNTRLKFDNMLFRPEFEYYSDGYYALIKGDYSVASSNFYKAISQKPNYAPPYYYLAEMAYRQQLYDSATQIIIHILNNLKADIDIKNKTLNLASTLFIEMTDIAAREIQKKNLNEAVSILQIALNLCASTSEFMCNGKAEILLRKARQDMFDSWVSITTKSVENRNTELSINYLNWTQAYLKEYKTLIGDTSDLNSLKLRMVKLLIQSAEYNLSAGRPKKALYYMNYADSLNAQSSDKTTIDKTTYLKNLAYSKVKTNEKRAATKTQNNQIEESKKEVVGVSKENQEEINIQDRYNKFILVGQSEMKAGNQANAYNYFKSAKDIENNTAIIPYDSLTQILQKLGKPIILSEIKSGDLVAWGFHFEMVRSIIKLAKAEMLEIGLEKDEDILEALNRLEKLSFDNQCNEVSTQFTQSLKTASKSLMLNNYNSANYFWQKAIQIVKSNPDCNLDSLIPLTLIQKNQAAIQFQQIEKEIDTALLNGNDSLAFYLTIDLQNLYVEDSIERFKLLHFNTFSLAQAHPQSAEIQFHQLNYIIEKGEIALLYKAIQNLQNSNALTPKHQRLLKRSVALFAKNECKNCSIITAWRNAKFYFPNRNDLRLIFLKNYKSTQ